MKTIHKEIFIQAIFFTVKIVWNMRNVLKLKPEQWLHKNEHKKIKLKYLIYVRKIFYVDSLSS